MNALRDRMAALTEGVGPGPWHPVYTYAVGGGRVFDCLDNPGGDSSFPDGEDIAAFVNALPALLDVAEAARALIDFGPSNRSGAKYAAKTAALDALDDALERLDGVS